jgi:hypothetical protein
MHVHTLLYIHIPKNLIPQRGSNPGLLVREADALSTATRRQGSYNMLSRLILGQCKISDEKFCFFD